MTNLKKIAILGSTGSIGKNALSVIRTHKDCFQVTALTANTQTELLLEQAREFSPAFLAVSGNCEKTEFLEQAKPMRCAFGKEALIEACEGADIVLLAITGIAGLPAFEYCLKHRIKVALATKEAMVCGGKMVRALMDNTGTEVLPVDSELSAIFQCLAGEKKEDISRIFLTASGGPFRTYSKEKISHVTKKQALKHPNWEMGQKITIDCATMMNKGLEIMETRWFFDVLPEMIQVVVHPESVIHSMVEMKDHSILAQLGVADMRLPIAYAFSYPKRLDACAKPLNFFEVGKLTFDEPDLTRFPCLALAYEAVQNDGALQLILNAANEIAVEWFLQEKIRFYEIAKVVERAMNSFHNIRVTSFEDIYEIDLEVRKFLG